MRAVLDTSVLVAAIRSSKGASSALVLAALERRLIPVISVPLILEYEAVLTRANHLQKAGLTATQVNALLDAFIAVSEPVRISFRWRPTSSDPDDDMLLETAVNGRADVLVTTNQRHFRDLPKSFGIEVFLPKQAWDRVEAK